jgi:hypothetical protein
MPLKSGVNKGIGLLFFIYLKTAPNIEIRRMLYHIDLNEVSKECKVDEFEFEVSCSGVYQLANLALQWTVSS